MRQIVCMVTLMLSVAACGGAQYETATPVGGNVFTWQTALKDCKGCHAEAPFMQSEAAFKASAGVLNQVTSGAMPKGNAYPQAKIEAFKKYLGSK